MKAIQVIGLLFSVFAIHNVQSMMPAIPAQFMLEHELMLGNLSVNEYLMRLERSSQEYGAMLRELRMAYGDQRNLYGQLMDAIPSYVNFVGLQRVNIVRKLSSLQREVRVHIVSLYKELREAEAAGTVNYRDF